MQRRRPLTLLPNDQFPPADIDLAPLLAARIPKDVPPLARRPSLHARKLHLARADLAGKPELLALNAVLIAHLRKESHPDHAPALFRRIWAEAGPALLSEISVRWLISSVITFGDHGETEAQRRVGLAINVLFSMMKLYEFERLYSGFDATAAFPINRMPDKGMPLGMSKFSLVDGGLDINLLAPIWRDAEGVPVVGPMACDLLQRLNEDPANLFRRIGIMRAERQLEMMDRPSPKRRKRMPKA